MKIANPLGPPTTTDKVRDTLPGGRPDATPKHHVDRRSRELLKDYQGTRERRLKRAARMDEASQFQLMAARFRKHRVATVCLFLLGLLYMVAVLGNFVAPYGKDERFTDAIYAGPADIHLFDEAGALHWPFIYGTSSQLDIQTFSYRSVVDEEGARYPIRLFVETERYELFNVIPMDRRLLGTEGGEPLFLLGADSLGRDLFSRIIYAARISLFIGLGGVAISFLLGIVLGGISGYFGGITDTLIQRLIEFIISIPQIPLWMGLSAAIPLGWSGIQTFFAITLILSLASWTDLARVVRGKVITLRDEDYVTAARISSATSRQIIFRHLLPGVTSYLVVSLSLAIPFTILGETALSFLGLGISAPDVSWGSLLQDAQDVVVISNYPWLLAPVGFVMLAVILFNFVGDGLRDAADPYSR